MQRPPAVRWRARDAVFRGDRTVIMGVVNVTPDSFSDGGMLADPSMAIEQGLRLRREGADLIDVGGESTRPGADPVDADVELERVLRVVKGLVAEGVLVSVDTSKALVARDALEVGASVVNDVTALSDPAMAETVAKSGAGVVLMHMQGDPQTMQVNPRYQDVTAEVAKFLHERAQIAQAAGIDPEAICIDPGIGFGKTYEHNLALLRRLDELTRLGFPVLVGTSRKSFLGKILDEPDPAARDLGTSATTVLAIAAGALAIRVHDVALSRQVARVADAIVRGDNGWSPV